MSNSAPTKTPFYRANHAERYARQELIDEIQSETGINLISFVCGRSATIARDDVMAFQDLLHNVAPETRLDLLLHTPGGDVDTAEKLLSMVRDTVKTARLRVIVPDFAKSAGTLIAIGADSIVMSDTSELGPMDPQFELRDARGNILVHSVLHYLAAYQEHSEALRKNPDDRVAAIMLSKLEPETVKLVQSVRDRATRCAERALQLGMFRNKPDRNHTAVAGRLVSIDHYPSHRQRIGWDEAKKDLQLEVEYLLPSTRVWQKFWELHLRQRISLHAEEKLFESKLVSLTTRMQNRHRDPEESGEMA